MLLTDILSRDKSRWITEKYGITTVEEAQQLTDEQLLNVRYIGRKAVEKIRRYNKKPIRSIEHELDFAKKQRFSSLNNAIMTVYEFAAPSLDPDEFVSLEKSFNRLLDIYNPDK